MARVGGSGCDGEADVGCACHRCSMWCWCDNFMISNDDDDGEEEGDDDDRLPLVVVLEVVVVAVVGVLVTVIDAKALCLRL